MTNDFEFAKNVSVGRWIILDFCETEKASMAKNPQF